MRPYPDARRLKKSEKDRKREILDNIGLFDVESPEKTFYYIKKE